MMVRVSRKLAIIFGLEVASEDQIITGTIDHALSTLWIVTEVNNLR